MIQLPDPAEEAQRLLNDPDHLRRKADFIEKMLTDSLGNKVLEEVRRRRVKELRTQADAIDKASKADPFVGIVDVPTNDGWDA